MKRRILLKSLAMTPVLSFISACEHEQIEVIGEASTPITPLNKPHNEWRGQVSYKAYKVLFEGDTEYPGASALIKEDREGTFICAACYLPLFESIHKYQSGTGWPSFTQPIPGHIATRREMKMIVLRTEYHCVRCSGHQGHVFNDGPAPRGERWCNNGVALKFVPVCEQLPALRS